MMIIYSCALWKHWNTIVSFLWLYIPCRGSLVSDIICLINHKNMIPKFQSNHLLTSSVMSTTTIGIWPTPFPILCLISNFWPYIWWHRKLLSDSPWFVTRQEFQSSHSQWSNWELVWVPIYPSSKLLRCDTFSHPILYPPHNRIRAIIIENYGMQNFVGCLTIWL